MVPFAGVGWFLDCDPEFKTVKMAKSHFQGTLGSKTAKFHFRGVEEVLDSDPESKTDEIAKSRTWVGEAFWHTFLGGGTLIVILARGSLLTLFPILTPNTEVLLRQGASGDHKKGTLVRFWQYYNHARGTLSDLIHLLKHFLDCLKNNWRKIKGNFLLINGTLISCNQAN